MTMTPSAGAMELNYRASGAVSPHRIVKFTTTDRVVSQASAATDKFCGVSTQVSTATGERIEVVRTGIAPVEYGGNVAAGDPLTSDANGKAIVATFGTRFIGIAEEQGDDGTIGSMLIAHGYIETEPE